LLVNTPATTVNATNRNLTHTHTPVIWRILAVVATVVATLYAGRGNATTDCGHIELARHVELNNGTEAYAHLLSAIDELILRDGFACSVNRVDMRTGDDQRAWPNVSEKAVISSFPVNSAGRPIGITADATWLQSVNQQPVTDVGEGWWITPATVELHPELKTVLDVIEHPELFPTDNDPSTGTFVGCPDNTNCQLINANLFRAFQMQEKNWKLTTPKTISDLDLSISAAVEQDQNWFGYHGAPSAIIGRYKLIKLDFGIEFTGDKNWDGCIARAVADCEEPKPSAWRPLHLHTFVTETFATSVPASVIAYLSVREVPGNVLSSLLAVQEDESLSVEDTAVEFLKQHSDIWKTWMSADVADKIVEALTSQH
jgi:glycine betaine/proline transport system substrate-binding protein